MADPDRDFILAGIQSGFDIIDPGCAPARVELDNHQSASPSNPLYSKVSAQVLEEINNNNYVEVSTPPVIVSPLGAIPKADGGIRLIHDCSRPQSFSVNSYALVEEKFHFQSVDDAADMIRRGAYMAKVDLKSAYRSVGISKHSQQVTGLKWCIDGQTRYFVDTKLPFGAKMAPGIFHRLSQAVKRIMAKKGFQNIVAYLDDFFICEDSIERCAAALAALLQLLRDLGFMINWSKVVDPCQVITFLGIEIDSVNMQLRLSDAKMDSIKSELCSFAKRSRASKKQLQSLAGKLNWAAAVVRGGRVFLRRIFDKIASLKGSYHKAKLDLDILADISWWSNFMSTFNGKSLLLDSRPMGAVYTDACLEGGGGHWGENWFYVNWNVDCPLFADSHINIKEVLAAVIAAHHWGHLWTNHKILLMTDNTVTVSGINRGTSKNKTIMGLLRYLFCLSVQYNFVIRAVHIAGVNNVKADLISRLHEPGSFWSLENPMCVPGPWAYPYHCISWAASRFLFCRHWSADLGVT